MSDVSDLADLARVNLGPDDVLVARHKRVLSHAEIAALKEHLATVFPDNRVLVLTGGVELSVVCGEDVR